MGCVSAKIVSCGNISPTIKRLESIRATLGKGISFQADANSMDRLQAKVGKRNSFQADTDSMDRLQAKVGIICSIPNELILAFAKKGLIWEGETNQEGVILYNTLIASDNWVLEEVILEELL